MPRHWNVMEFKSYCNSFLIIMWTSCKSHSAISMWQNQNCAADDRHAFSSLNGWMQGNETIVHFYSNSLFALHEIIQIGTSLYLPSWRRNALFVRNSVSEYVLLGLFDSFVGLSASGQNASLTAGGTCCSKHWSKEKFDLRQTGNLSSAWGKGQFRVSSISYIWLSKLLEFS